MMKTLRLSMLAMAMVGLFAITAEAQQKPRQQSGARAVTHPPRLKNRAQIVSQRDALARQVLKPGDSLTVIVFARIDSLGVPQWPQVKAELKNERAKEAAMELVENMRFIPAQSLGQPVTVLMKIPVKFARPAR